MSDDNYQLSTTNSPLFTRVVAILEQARNNVVRSVNSNMVLAYWLIGREIVEEIQAGEARAEYGRQVAEKLSKQLKERYGKGFSSTNIWYFRQFYLAYSDRVQILHPSGGELTVTTSKAFNPNLSWSHYRALMMMSSILI